jgi:hypothetical protein
MKLGKEPALKSITCETLVVAP